jgi:16S rRNA (adenine1518-N6/adenine1519-N6)-dimethyltransferase
MEYRFKKSLGQHFLVNPEICQAIVDAVLLEKPSQLLEVGPGAGAITKYFLQQENLDFKAVELDTEKVAYLHTNYPSSIGKIIEESILDIAPPFDGKFDVVGNFPYNISTEIIFKMLDWKEQLNSVVGMFQKEVAQRIAAKEGSKVYGVTSVLLQAFFSIEYLMDVNEDCFNPPPKVKSGVIKLKPLQEAVVMKSHTKFKQLVKMAFNQRRKTLRNATKSLFLPDKLEDPIFNKRAEQLSVQDFADLTFKMQ